MLAKTRPLALLIGAGALLALPATGAAEPKRCEKTPNVGYIVSGTLESFTAGDPGSVTITVTEANGHATKSGDAVVGQSYTVSGDAFRTVLEGFEGDDTASPGDAVQVIGRIPRTKAKCAPEGTSVAERYGTVDVRQVVITDSDPDV